MKRAKIVATLGPASSAVEKIVELIVAGVDVFRVNMSHGDHATHREVMLRVREASKRAQKEVAILMDLQGPKIRVDKLPKPLQLEKEQVWVIGPTEVKEKYPQYKDHFIPTVYKNLVKDAEVGCSVLFDDGLIEARAIQKENDVLKIKILVGGELKSNKGINLPDVNVSAPSFTDKDRKDLIFGLGEGIDYLALSFVRRREDILQVKYLLHELKVNVPIVAKIERPEAVRNIEDILKVTDVVMIARGDMGVELGNHLVPAVQKRIINLCNDHGVPVITATQMLESMIENSRPTRAEASDVANAIWDGTDAVMLSGETASGQYPVKAVEMMNSIIEEAEKEPKERPLLRHIDLRSVSAANMVAASLIAEKTYAKWIISVTQSGKSCLILSRFRPKTPVLGVTNSVEVVRKMQLYWGITPYLFEKDLQDMGQLQFEMIEHIRKSGHVVNGDKIVITHGDGRYFSRSNSNTIRTEIIKDAPRVEGSGDSMQTVEFDRGIIHLDNNICSSCQICVSTCPHDIWAVGAREQRNTYIDELRAPECTLDMQCVANCPTGAIEIIGKE